MIRKRISGSKAVLKNLHKEIARIKGATPAGLRLAAIIIKIESMKRTPVDTGDLRGSHYVAIDPSPRRTVAEVGVMQDYGIYVHENLSVNHPTGEAKFLEKAVGAKAREAAEAIRRTAKVRS